MRATNISFSIPGGAAESGAAVNTKLYAGNNRGSTSTLVKSIGTVGDGSSYNSALTDSGYYQYYTLYLENQGSAYNDRVDITSINISGVTREVTEGTASDYDYKIEGGKTYIVKENDTYKAIKSYTKGQVLHT